MTSKLILRHSLDLPPHPAGGSGSLEKDSPVSIVAMEKEE